MPPDNREAFFIIELADGTYFFRCMMKPFCTVSIPTLG
jgi:hypothetical protein